MELLRRYLPTGRQALLAMTSGWTFYEFITYWDCEDETIHDKNNIQAFCVVSRFKGSGREYIMKPATLIFPHQLFRQHPGLSKEREIFLVEEQLFFSGVRSSLKFHKKKLMLHRDFLKKNPRMKVMINQIDRMGRERMKQHLDIADSFLDQR